MVRPPAFSAPWWAAESIPRASPETTVNPVRASDEARRSAIRNPYEVHRREPTRAMASWSRCSYVPCA